MRLKPPLLATLLASTLALSLQGCGVAGYDNREKIAQAALYNDKGELDEKVFAGALVEKFASASSPVMALTKFVESFGGQCSTNPKDKDAMHCSIPQTSTICVESRIDLFVATNNVAISSITAKSRANGC